jgi:hypothetical protein
MATYSYTVRPSSDNLAWEINGERNPILTLQAGNTYNFNVIAPNNPFYIKTDRVTGTFALYDNGVTNNGATNGTVTIVIPDGIVPPRLFYQSANTFAMGGALTSAATDRIDEETSILVNEQVPEFVRQDHSRFVKFLEAYYEWFDSPQNPGGTLKRLIDFGDVDNSVDTFVEYFYRELATQFPRNVRTANKRTILKNIKDFFLAKGTPKSYEFLFNLLYGETIEFYYPKRDILRTSDGKWESDITIRVSNPNGADVFDAEGRTIYQVEDQISQITGLLEEVIVAQGLVERSVQFFLGSTLVTEYFLSNVTGEYINSSTGDTRYAFYVDDAGNRIELKVEPIVASINVVDGGSGYSPNDLVILSTQSGDTGRNAIASVKSVKSGYVSNLTIDNGGANYQVGDRLVFANDGTNGAGASGFVEEVDVNGAITVLRLENGGNGYRLIPTVSVLSNDGTGAEITVSGTNVGTIKQISVDNFGGLYYEVPTMDLTNIGDGNAVAEIVIGGTARYTGRFTSNDGFISDAKYLQDNKFYQEFSYVLRTGLSVDAYRDTIKKLVHPAGMELFGEVFITSKVEAGMYDTYTNDVNDTYNSFAPRNNSQGIPTELYKKIILQVIQDEVTKGGQKNIGNSATNTNTLRKFFIHKRVITDSNLDTYRRFEDYTTLFTGASISKVSTITQGTGYSATPTATISDPTGTGATVEVFVDDNQRISSVSVDVAGAGYVSPVVIVNDGSGDRGAEFQVNIDADGSITSVDVIDGGEGWDGSETLTIYDADKGVGSDATLSYTLVDDRRVTGIAVQNSGYGYTNPTVSISDSTGLGATAKVTIGNKNQLLTSSGTISDTFSAQDINFRKYNTGYTVQIGDQVSVMETLVEEHDYIVLTESIDIVDGDTVQVGTPIDTKNLTVQVADKDGANYNALPSLIYPLVEEGNVIANMRVETADTATELKHVISMRAFAGGDVIPNEFRVDLLVPSNVLISKVITDSLKKGLQAQRTEQLQTFKEYYRTDVYSDGTKLYTTDTTIDYQNWLNIGDVVHYTSVDGVHRHNHVKRIYPDYILMEEPFFNDIVTGEEIWYVKIDRTGTMAFPPGRNLQEIADQALTEIQDRTLEDYNSLIGIIRTNKQQIVKELGRSVDIRDDRAHYIIEKLLSVKPTVADNVTKLKIGPQKPINADMSHFGVGTLMPEVGDLTGVSINFLKSQITTFRDEIANVADVHRFGGYARVKTSKQELTISLPIDVTIQSQILYELNLHHRAHEVIGDYRFFNDGSEIIDKGADVPPWHRSIFLTDHMQEDKFHTKIIKFDENQNVSANLADSPTQYTFTTVENQDVSVNHSSIYERDIINRTFDMWTERVDPESTLAAKETDVPKYHRSIFYQDHMDGRKHTNFEINLDVDATSGFRTSDYQLEVSLESKNLEIRDARTVREKTFELTANNEVNVVQSKQLEISVLDNVEATPRTSVLKATTVENQDVSVKNHSSMYELQLTLQSGQIEELFGQSVGDIVAIGSLENLLARRELKVDVTSDANLTLTLDVNVAGNVDTLRTQREIVLPQKNVEVSTSTVREIEQVNSLHPAWSEHVAPSREIQFSANDYPIWARSIFLADHMNDRSIKTLVINTIDIKDEISLSRRGPRVEFFSGRPINTIRTDSLEDLKRELYRDVTIENEVSLNANVSVVSTKANIQPIQSLEINRVTPNPLASVNYAPRYSDLTTSAAEQNIADGNNIAAYDDTVISNIDELNVRRFLSYGSMKGSYIVYRDINDNITGSPPDN